MDYIKFNCYDLAAQNAEIYNVYSKVQQLSNELSDIISSLNPQIENYPDLQGEFRASQMAVADIVEQFLAAHTSLDQAIDIYYLAEKKALQEAEKLPVGLYLERSEREIKEYHKISISIINSNELILEDWLAELIYNQHNEDKNKG